jgi:hypothetical protein
MALVPAAATLAVAELEWSVSGVACFGRLTWGFQRARLAWGQNGSIGRLSMRVEWVDWSRNARTRLAEV